MTNAFSEALSPLAASMPRAVRDLEVLRVSSQLDGEDFAVATQSARAAALRWAAKRAGARLPRQAWDFEDFEMVTGGRNSAAVHIKSDELDIWALRAEDPDKNVAGRIWSTEVVIGGRLGERPFLSARLIASTTEQELQVEPHVPGLILQMADAPGLVRAGRKLVSEPQTIETENAAEDLCDHLEDQERRLPVIVVTTSEIGTSLLDDLALARAVTGIARVVRVPTELTWVLTNRFGKYRSVFGGAVRAYMPGFSVTDDPFRHRLFLADRLRNGDDVASAIWLRRATAQLSVSGTRLGRDVLDFASVKTASRRLKTAAMKDVEAPDEDLIATANELIESLEEQIKEKDKEVDGYIEVAEAAEARASASEQEHRALLYRVRQLEEVIKRGGATPTEETPLPQAWGEFVDWIDGTYPDRVVLTPSARRMVKSPAFEDVEAVARAVTWLATEHHERRIDGGGSLRDVQVENGVRNSPCGGDTYKTSWRGRPYDVDWHVKNGGNTRDPKKCLRIYYFWEPEACLTVIDHLPGHIKTAAT